MCRWFRCFIYDDLFPPYVFQNVLSFKLVSMTVGAEDSHSIFDMELDSQLLASALYSRKSLHLVLIMGIYVSNTTYVMAECVVKDPLGVWPA